MTIQKKYPIKEASEKLGFQRAFIMKCIYCHWVKPFEIYSMNLDDEDLARIRFIRELKDDLGANDESISIILHLLDQLYFIKNRLKKHS